PSSNSAGNARFPAPRARPLTGLAVGVLYECMHTQAQTLSLLRIEPTGVPIYLQLREQFLRAMGAGLLSAGDQMPTMRQVAVALKVDLNTVRHAYDDLERLGAAASSPSRRPPWKAPRTRPRPKTWRARPWPPPPPWGSIPWRFPRGSRRS